MLVFSTAVVGALLAAPATLAATLSVDDDRQECTAAAFTSVQDAIDAAAPGDTVAICPGTYSEGTGNANTNAITVNKTLTLKGAGADLVTISPRRIRWRASCGGRSGRRSCRARCASGCATPARAAR